MSDEEGDMRQGAFRLGLTPEENERLIFMPIR
jgi:hypothetical protein